MATTEALQLCNPTSGDFRVPKKWRTNPGTLIRFSDGLNGVVVGEVRVPNAPIGENPHYECFANLDDAVANLHL